MPKLRLDIEGSRNDEKNLVTSGEGSASKRWHIPAVIAVILLLVLSIGVGLHANTTDTHHQHLTSSLNEGYGGASKRWWTSAMPTLVARSLTSECQSISGYTFLYAKTSPDAPLQYSPAAGSLLDISSTCSNTPGCVAFTTEGYLASRVATVSYTAPDTCRGMYVSNTNYSSLLGTASEAYVVGEVTVTASTGLSVYQGSSTSHTALLAYSARVAAACEYLNDASVCPLVVATQTVVRDAFFRADVPFSSPQFSPAIYVIDVLMGVITTSAANTYPASTLATPIRTEIGGCAANGAFALVAAAEAAFLAVSGSSPSAYISGSTAATLAFNPWYLYSNCDAYADPPVTPNRTAADSIFCAKEWTASTMADVITEINTYSSNMMISDGICMTQSPASASAVGYACHVANEQCTRVPGAFGSTSLTTVSQVKWWISNYGAAVTIMELYSDFLSYTGGIYTPGGWAQALGMTLPVTVVGFNDDQEYWTVRLPWGTNWGMSGYAQVAYGAATIVASDTTWGISWEPPSGRPLSVAQVESYNLLSPAFTPYKLACNPNVADIFPIGYDLNSVPFCLLDPEDGLNLGCYTAGTCNATLAAITAGQAKGVYYPLATCSEQLPLLYGDPTFSDELAWCSRAENIQASVAPICGSGVCSSAWNCSSCSEDCFSCSTCGNGVCDAKAGETYETCIQDCHCGDGMCEAYAYGENCLNCASDCGSCGACGDGVCQPFINETCVTCPSDCKACPSTVAAQTGTVPTTYKTVCGDGICETDTGENCYTCTADCRICGSNNQCGDLTCSVIFPANSIPPSPPNPPPTLT